MAKQQTIILAGNGSYQNRGCEAIVRGTVEIVRQRIGNERFVSANFGRNYIPEESDPDIIHHPINVSRYSKAWFVQNTLRIAKVPRTWFPILGRYLSDAEVVLAVGGDNYSMDYGSLRVHLALLDYVIERNLPLVIWAGSVGPFNKRGSEYEAFVAKKLRKATAILAREDVTVEYLSRIGVEENVRRVADPAFIMEPKKPELSLPFEITQDSIGFNFSPLMARFIYGGDISRTIQLVSEIIRSVASEFKRPIILVPHVHAPTNDDYAFLRAVINQVPDVKIPIYLLPRTLNAAEVKWAVSRMACFAGARMHSTIAALSSGVPTLSFSYSIKSVGLNRDVFGHNEFVLEPMQLEPDKVTKVMHSLLMREDDVRTQLKECLPTIHNLALRGGDYLESILKNGKL